MSAALAVQGLSAWYGQAQALFGVDFEVAPGEAVGVLGRNGAGKTTLLRCLGGLHARHSGRFFLDGEAIPRPRTHLLARAGLSLVREGAQCSPSLTALQHLEVGQRLARLRGRTPPTLAQACEMFPLLEPVLPRAAGLLSGGQRQALALATAFASQPTVLLLDEPSAGLAPPVARELYASIRRLASGPIAVVIVEQEAAWLRGVVQRSYQFELGQVLGEE